MVHCHLNRTQRTKEVKYMPIFTPLPNIAPTECLNHRHIDYLAQIILGGMTIYERDQLIERLNAQYLAWMHADLLDAPEVVERADAIERFLAIAQFVD